MISFTYRGSVVTSSNSRVWCWFRLLRADLDYQRYSLISQIAVYRSLFHCILLFIPRLKPSSRLLVGSHFPAY
jgi:hypothetical protein